MGELLLSVDDSVKDSQHATWGLKKAAKDAWQTSSKAAKKAAKDAKKVYKKVSSADEVAENPLANDELLLSVDDSVKDSQHATWGLKKAAKDAWQTSSKAAKKPAKDAKKVYKKVSSADEVA